MSRAGFETKITAFEKPKTVLPQEYGKSFVDEEADFISEEINQLAVRSPLIDDIVCVNTEVCLSSGYKFLTVTN
jgi:hypothetical protein